MKPWMYPLFVILGACSYGILSTIIKLAIADGYTAPQAVTSQYYTGFLLAAFIYFVTHRKLPKFGGGFTLVVAGTLTAITGTVYGKAVSLMPASLAVVMLFQFTWIGMLFDCIARRRLPKRIEVISLLFLFGGTVFAAGVLDADLSGCQLFCIPHGESTPSGGDGHAHKAIVHVFLRCLSDNLFPRATNHLGRYIDKRLMGIRFDFRGVRHYPANPFIFYRDSKSRYGNGFDIKRNRTAGCRHCFDAFIA